MLLVISEGEIMQLSIDNKQPNIIRMALVFLIIASLSGFYLFSLNSSSGDKQPLAKEGVIDLNQWDTKNILGLKGEWEFYPGLLLSPGMDLPEDRVYIEVPGSWENWMGGNPEGAGTYRLVIRLPNDGHFGIKTKTLRFASKIYANDLEVASTGEIGYNKEEMVRESKYRFTSVFSQNNEIELLIPMSSFGYMTGGILTSIEFGDYFAMQAMNYRSRTIEIIVVAAYHILGIYFILNYYLGGKKKYFLYFGLSFVFMALYLSTMNEQLLDLIFN